MTGRVVLFFLVVIVVIGLIIYFVSSGAFGNSASFVSSLLGHDTSTVSFSSSSSVNIPPSPSPTYYLGPPNGSGSGVNSNTSPSPSSIPSYEIPTGFTASQLSPYFHEVTFGGISYGYGTYAGQITLSAYPPQGQVIDVTGWQIKSNRSGEFIPQAINVYDPSGLTAPTDIRLKADDELTLYSNSGPFNLRLNECVGYLNEASNFNPQLPENCPYVDRGAITNLSGACQSYIESLGSCQLPNFNSPSVAPNDYSCVNYLEDNFGYHACFEAHEADTDFLSNQIYVWMGANVVDPEHDQVELLDKNGLLVDLYSY